MNNKAGSLLWKVYLESSDSNAPVYSYLFGTMHSASIQAWSHMEAIKPIILKCAHFFGETSEEGLAPKGKIWDLPEDWQGSRHLVGKKRFEKINRLLVRQYNLHLERLDPIPPLMIMSIISESMMCHRQGNIAILDQELWQFAKKLGIPAEGIESAREQFAIYSQIPFLYQCRQLKKMLLNLSGSRKNILMLANAYQKNDPDTLFRLSKKSLGEVRRILLYNRNKVMAARISQILNNREPNFVAIGAAHLPGTKGVLRYLKCEGIHAEPVPLKN